MAAKHLPAICLLFIIVSFAACTPPGPVSEQEAKTTAAAIEKAVRNQKPGVLLNLFDIPMLRENVARQNKNLSKIDINAAVSETALKQFATKVVEAVKTGTYKLVTIYDSVGVRHMIFRIYGEEGLNYHDFPLYKINGQVKAGDLFNFITGEYISKTFAGLLGADPTMSGDGASGSGKTFVKIVALKKAKDYAGTLAAVKTLSPALIKTKAVQMIKIDASRYISDEAYTAALEEFAGLYPDEPNTYLMMLDVYYMNKEYDKAMYSVNKLDSLVKGDPLLNLYRGNLYRDMGDTAQSLAAFEKCFAYDPYIKNNMQQLVVTYVEANETAKAKAVIEKYKQNPRFKEEDIDILYQQYPALK